jgi:hypothetical protein
MLLPLFQALNNSALGAYMTNSTYGFAMAEVVHLLALALLGGTVLLIDLRLLGIGLRHQTVARVARSLSPLLTGSLVAMLVSGVLLVSGEALKCYYNPAFRVKMLLLVVAVTFYFALHRRVVAKAAITPSLWTKAAALISLALWLSVGLAGRAIGFL